MKRKLLIASLWFPFACGLLLVNLVLLNHLSVQSKLAANKTEILSPLGDIMGYNVAAANTSMVLGTEVIAGDARAKLLQQFLNQYDSPLAPYANLIVSEADKNNIDFRLIVAIAMCESNLGKHIPKDSFNAYGAGVYTGQQTGINFGNWEEGIVWMSKYMKERYADKGFRTLREIGAVYAPPSVMTGYSWSNCVETFQQSIF